MAVKPQAANPQAARRQSGSWHEGVRDHGQALAQAVRARQRRHAKHDLDTAGTLVAHTAQALLRVKVQVAPAASTAGPPAAACSTG